MSPTSKRLPAATLRANLRVRLGAVGAILAVLALAPALSACDDPAASAVAKPARPVQTQKVVFAPADENREFAGVVRARFEPDLGFRVAGKIVTRLVDAGDRVKAGQVVARLDPRDLQLQVESAEAELMTGTYLHKSRVLWDAFVKEYEDSILAGLAVFTWVISFRIRPLLFARPDVRWDDPATTFPKLPERLHRRVFAENARELFGL